MVFADTKKFDGNELVPLSLSQLKQIAGRAGRYGLHGDSSAPGIVTTLKKDDLADIQKAVTSKTVPLTPHAVLPLTLIAQEHLEQLLPRDMPHAAFADLQRTACRLPSHFVPGIGRAESEDAAKALDEECKGMTLVERMRAADAPVAWRDDGVRPVALKFMQAYRKDHCVRWAPALEGTGLLEALEAVQAAKAGKAPLPGKSQSQALQSDKHSWRRPAIPARRTEAKQGTDALNDLPSALAQLETLYRIAVVYMWYGMRQTLAYPDRAEAVAVKEECQALIEWCLSAARPGRFSVERKRVGGGAKEEKGKGLKRVGDETTRREGQMRILRSGVRTSWATPSPIKGTASSLPTPPDEYVKPSVIDAAKPEERVTA